jgi:hypothetical protein
MRPITSLPNTEAPDADFPGGRLKNTVGANAGTRVNESMVGDWSQFFYKLMNEAGITPNGLPDSEYSGFQLFKALQSSVPKKYVKELTVGGDGQVVTITRAEIQSAVGSGINPFSNGVMLGATEISQNVDIKVVMYVFELNTAGKWSEVDLATGSNSVNIVDTNGNIEITLDSFIVDDLTARIIIFG